MNDNNGFTLVEILVSITLLLLIGIVFFQFFTLSQKTTSHNEVKLVSINLAQSVLEEMKSSKWNEPAETGDYSDIIKGTKKKSYNYNSCVHDSNDEQLCKKLFTKEVKGRTYEIEIRVDSPNDVGLYPVEIKIFYKSKNPLSSVKGLIQL